MTELQGKNHYENEGYKENRQYKYENISYDFNAKIYTELNSDYSKIEKVNEDPDFEQAQNILKQNKKVEELKQKEEEQVAEILSSKYGIKYVDLSGISINTDALNYKIKTILFKYTFGIQ